MTSIRFLPPRVPMVDLRTGNPTREWYLFLQQLISTVDTADTTDTELAAMNLTSGADAQEYAMMQEFRQTPARSGEFDELRKDIEGLGIAP